MADHQLNLLARRIRALEKARLAAKSPQLANSTIVGGAIQATDITGETLTMILGQQFDGTTASAVVGGPTPPTPNVPLVSAVGYGTLSIYWDGTFSTSLVAPMDFARITVHAEPVSSYDGPDPLNQAFIVGEMHSGTGGEVTAALAPGVEYIVYLVCWSQSGKPSAASGVATGTPATPPSGGSSSDGDAPTEASTLIAVGGIGSLFFRWSSISNADPVTYSLYVAAGADPDTSTDAQLAARGTELTFASLRNLPGGADLDPSGATTYKAVVVVSDADGVGPSSNIVSVTPAQVTGPDIAANAVTADLLVANDALVDALRATDLSAVNLESVNIDGGTISIATSASGTVTTDFGTGTSLPSGWTVVTTGTDPGNSFVAPSVVANGSSPAGATGSTLKLGTGNAASGGAGGAMSYHMEENTLSGSSQELRARVFSPLDGSNIGEGIYAYVARSGTYGQTAPGQTASGSDGQAVWLKLVHGTSSSNATFTVGISSNGAGTTLGSISCPVSASGWYQIHLSVINGKIEAAVWPDATTEPDHTIFQASTSFAPGVGGFMTGVNGLLGSDGLTAYVDSVTIRDFETGFAVGPDGAAHISQGVVDNLVADTITASGDSTLQDVFAASLTITGTSDLHDVTADSIDCSGTATLADVVATTATLGDGAVADSVLKVTDRVTAASALGASFTGAGTLGVTSGVNIASASYRRRIRVYAGALATAIPSGFVEFAIRNNGTAVRNGRITAANQSWNGYYTFILEPSTTASFQVVAIATASGVTVTSNGNFTYMSVEEQPIL